MMREIRLLSWGKFPPHKVQEALSWLGLEQLAQQRPRELSGDQQRVALARALVIRPQVLLLDEPFSALDSPTWVQDSLRLQREQAVPIIFVTHDLAEATLPGEQMAVIADGRILQLDTPQQVRQRPANPLVAELVGVMGQLYSTTMEKR